MAETAKTQTTCPHCGKFHSATAMCSSVRDPRGPPSIESYPAIAPSMPERRRTEALRAASRIVAGSLMNEDLAPPKALEDQKTAADATLHVAEQFDRWLETGER